MEKVREWLAATHGVPFELLRHFLRRFFDSEMSGAGEWSKVAVGIFAALVSVSAVSFKTYMGRYNLMQDAGLSAAEILREMRADQLTFIGLTMAVTAVLTVLQWQSLFPSVRDYLALAALPVKPRQIFLSESGALLLMFAVYLLAMNLVPAAAFSSVTSGRAGALGQLRRARRRLCLRLLRTARLPGRPAQPPSWTGLREGVDARPDHRFHGRNRRDSAGGTAARRGVVVARSLDFISTAGGFDHRRMVSGPS